MTGSHSRSVDSYAELSQNGSPADGPRRFGTGRSHDGDQRGPDATASARIEGSARHFGVPVADATVTFELTLEHGRHRIEASAVGYERVSGDVQVKFGRTTELTVTLRPDDSR